MAETQLAQAQGGPTSCFSGLLGAFTSSSFFIISEDNYNFTLWGKRLIPSYFKHPAWSHDLNVRNCLSRRNFTDIFTYLGITSGLIYYPHAKQVDHNQDMSVKQTITETLPAIQGFIAPMNEKLIWAIMQTSTD